MGRLITILWAGIKDELAEPLALGKVYFFSETTGNLLTVYQDPELSVPHPNPATLDSLGKLTAFTDDRLKIVAETALGDSVRTYRSVGVRSSDISTSKIKLSTNGGLRSDSTGTAYVSLDESSIKLTDGKIALGKVKQAHLGTRRTNAGDRIYRSNSVTMLLDGGSGTTTKGPFAAVGTGRAYQLQLQYDYLQSGGALPLTSAYARVSALKNFAQPNSYSTLRFLRNDTIIGTLRFGFAEPNSQFSGWSIPACCFRQFDDDAPVGSVSYSLRGELLSGLNLDFRGNPEISLVEE